MTLQSMTGFARIDGRDDRCTWYWEVRTVNGKGLDVRTRLPAGYDELEPRVRKSCSQHLKRGNCTINLFVQREAGSVGVSLNEDILNDVMSAADRAAELTGLERPTLDALLGIRGVLEIGETQVDDADRDRQHTAMINDLGAAILAVRQTRGDEGSRLHAILSKIIDQIEECVRTLVSTPGRDLDCIRKRFQSRLDRLLMDEQAIDPHRLHQEIVLLATKADIEEELSRLTSHVAAARELLQSEEPVGRQLDFLSQEFNREANTICSKSNNEAVTRLGMELKTAIDQFREQVQNIE